MLEFYLKSELPFFSKNPKDLTNYQLSKELPFFPKRSKRLTKHQILKNIYRFMTVQVFQENNMLLEIMQKLMMLKLPTETA